MTFRAMCSVPEHGPGGLVFSTSGFHCLLATRPVSSETSKAERGQVATIVLSGTRGPWLFLVIREGLGSRVRLRARSTQSLTNQLRLALEPECLENRQRNPQEMERTRSETLKLFVVSDVGRRSTLLSSIRSIRSWQSFWPKSGAPSLASYPWQPKPCRTLGKGPACWKPRRPHP